MKRHHTAETTGWTMRLSADPLSESLLECKQVEKICVHNIPEGGAEVEFTSGGTTLGYSADHHTRPRKTGLPAPESSKSAACSET